MTTRGARTGLAWSDDRSPRAGQALRLHRGRQRPVFLHPARPGHRLPRPERRREDHHHADDPGPRRADAGLGNRRRAQLPRPAGTHARGGRPPRRQGAARGPPGPRPPAVPGPEERNPPQPGADPAAGTDAGTDPDVIEITGMDSAEVGKLAAAHGIVLFELIPVRASLEEAFMELTRDSVEYQAAGGTR